MPLLTQIKTCKRSAALFFGLIYLAMSTVGMAMHGLEHEESRGAVLPFTQAPLHLRPAGRVNAPSPCPVCSWQASCHYAAASVAAAPPAFFLAALDYSAPSFLLRVKRSLPATSRAPPAV